MILGHYEIRTATGKLYGHFTYGDTPGSQSIANNASLERLANLRVHRPDLGPLTRKHVSSVPHA